MEETFEEFQERAGNEINVLNQELNRRMREIKDLEDEIVVLRGEVTDLKSQLAGGYERELRLHERWMGIYEGMFYGVEKG